MEDDQKYYLQPSILFPEDRIKKPINPTEDKIKENQQRLDIYNKKLDSLRDLRNMMQSKDNL